MKEAEKWNSVWILRETFIPLDFRMNQFHVKIKFTWKIPYVDFDWIRVPNEFHMENIDMCCYLHCQEEKVLCCSLFCVVFYKKR